MLCHLYCPFIDSFNKGWVSAADLGLCQALGTQVVKVARVPTMQCCVIREGLRKKIMEQAIARTAHCSPLRRTCLCPVWAPATSCRIQLSHHICTCAFSAPLLGGWTACRPFTTLLHSWTLLCYQTDLCSISIIVTHKSRHSLHVY